MFRLASARDLQMDVENELTAKTSVKCDEKLLFLKTRRYSENWCVQGVQALRGRLTLSLVPT